MIYLLRHGQTTTNAQRLLVGRSDPPLTALGERQARALSAHLGGVVEVWTSPLARARRTAELALPRVRARVVDAFIEVDYGTLDGRSLNDVSTDKWRSFEHGHDVAFGGGESLADVDARVHPALDALLGDPTSLLHQPERHLAIFTHVSPLKSVLVWTLGVSGATAWRTRVDNGSLSVVTSRGATPLLLRFNVVPALE